jgi:hypothetical protein
MTSPITTKLAMAFSKFQVMNVLKLYPIKAKKYVKVYKKNSMVQSLSKSLELISRSRSFLLFREPKGSFHVHIPPLDPILIVETMLK